VRADELAGALRSRFADVVSARGEVTVSIAPGEVQEALEWLRDEQAVSFDLLSDLTCSDWPGRSPRYWVTLHLRSSGRGHRVRLKVGLPDADPPRMPSVTGLYPAADWYEREVYDFYGVVFDGHPDLRRIELPDEWSGHPMRKTEPLAGVRTQYLGASVPPPDQRGL
jgi:NADH-quinone oxidoreductase subunit C